MLTKSAAPSNSIILPSSSDKNSNFTATSSFSNTTDHESDTNFLSQLTSLGQSELKEWEHTWETAISSAVDEMKKDPDLRKSIQENLESNASQDSFELTPLPGFVLKTTLSQSTSVYPQHFKVFINVCHSPYVPVPPLASDEEIRRAIEGSNLDGSPSWKVPMSLIGPKDDIDKLGRPCIVFDACIHSDVLTKTVNDSDFKLFILELAMEWVEEKHGMSVSRDFSLPKLKTKGTLSIHKIYRPKRPAMQTMQKMTPKYTLQQHSDHYQLCIPLPLIVNTQHLVIEIEQYQFYLDHPLYTLSFPFPLPIEIHHPKCDAYFDRQKKVVVVSLPLL